MRTAQSFYRFVLAGGLLLLAGGAVAAPPCPTPLRVGFVDAELGQLLRGQGTAFAEPPGGAVEIMRQAMADLGCEAEWVRMPVRRLLSELTHGQLALAVGLAADPERLSTLRFPVLPNGQPDTRLAIAEGRVLHYGLTAHRERLEAALRGPAAQDLRYGSLRGSVPSAMLQRQGLRVEDATDVPRALAMLRLARFDLLVMPDLLAPSGEALEGIAPVGPPLVVMRYFVPASPALAEQHSAWLATFWRTACKRSRGVFPALPPCPLG